MSDLETRTRQRALFVGAPALEQGLAVAAEQRTPGSLGVTLRPYQEEAISAFRAQLAAGKRRLVISIPTGTGKTVLGWGLARQLGQRTLWLAHRDELIQQPYETAGRVWPTAGRGIVQADRDDHTRQLVIASVQTVARETRLDRVLSQPFGFVVVDECHHAASESYRAVHERVGCFRPDGPPLLGLTATLERADGVGLATVFEEIAYHLTRLEAIDRGYLAPFVSERVELPLNAEVRALVDELLGRKPRRPREGHDGDALVDDDQDIDLKKAERAMLFAGVAEATARAVAERALERKTIVFTCSVDQAKRTAEAARALGLRAEHVSGATPRRERQAILARLKTGETRVLCNANVLVEGFDEPTVDCVVMARPTRSRSVYIQCVGRGLRRHPLKQDCLILDVVFATDLGVQTAATLAAGEPTNLFGTGGGGSANDRDPELSAQEEEARVLGVVKANFGEGVNPDGRQERVDGPRWLTVTPTCWALSLWPTGTLVVERLPQEEQPAGADLYEAFVMPREARSQSVRVSDPGAFEWVFGQAEEHLRSQARGALSARSPGWRRRPVSDPQARELAARGLAPVRTAGEAADLLTVSTVKLRLGY